MLRDSFTFLLPPRSFLLFCHTFFYFTSYRPCRHLVEEHPFFLLAYQQQLLQLLITMLIRMRHFGDKEAKAEMAVLNKLQPVLEEGKPSFSRFHYDQLLL